MVIDYREAVACAWRLEILQSDGNWIPLAPRSRLLVPFWLSKTTKILSNPCLIPPGGDFKKNDGSP
jgi:hypothetical protein